MKALCCSSNDSSITLPFFFFSGEKAGSAWSARASAASMACSTAFSPSVHLQPRKCLRYSNVQAVCHLPVQQWLAALLSLHQCTCSHNNVWKCSNLQVFVIYLCINGLQHYFCPHQYTCSHNHVWEHSNLQIVMYSCTSMACSTAVFQSIHLQRLFQTDLKY